MLNVLMIHTLNQEYHICIPLDACYTCVLGAYTVPHGAQALPCSFSTFLTRNGPLGPDLSLDQRRVLCRVFECRPLFDETAKTRRAARGRHGRPSENVLAWLPTGFRRTRGSGSGSLLPSW